MGTPSYKLAYFDTYRCNVEKPGVDGSLPLPQSRCLITWKEDEKEDGRKRMVGKPSGHILWPGAVFV